MVAKDPQSVPHTTYIELLRDNKKREQDIEAEHKHKKMEKQRKYLQDQVNHYSVNY